MSGSDTRTENKAGFSNYFQRQYNFVIITYNIILLYITQRSGPNYRTVGKFLFETRI